MSATSQGPVVVTENRFADFALLYARAEITVLDSLFDDELRLTAHGSVGVSDAAVADTALIMTRTDAYVFDSTFNGYTSIRLGNGDDELVIAGSSFDELHADGGRGENEFDGDGDEDDNTFGELDLRRFED
jgi:hypothetical protein